MAWRAFIRLGRPQYLFKSALLYGLGASAALYCHHGLSLGWYLFGQLFVSCGHLMTHYCNEYFDLEADRANQAPAGVTGGSRILADGILPPIVSLNAGFVLLFVEIALLIWMPTNASRWLCFGVVMLGWFYTAPPLKLNHRGLGELCSMLVIDLLCPILAFYLQAGTVDPFLLMVLLPNSILQYSYMMMMNLCDYEGDKAAGKKTLVVVLGPAIAARLYVLSHVLAYLSVVVLWPAGLPASIVLAIGLTLPLSMWLCWRALRGDYRAPSSKGKIAWWAASYTTLVAIATYAGLLLNPQIEWTRLSTSDGQFLCAMVLVICAIWILRNMWSKILIHRLKRGTP
jgi:1,4-dihydroxy-2-naphthoate octaprenyltransferase